MKMCKWMPLLTLLGIGGAAPLFADTAVESVTSVEETVVLAADDDDDDSDTDDFF